MGLGRMMAKTFTPPGAKEGLETAAKAAATQVLGWGANTHGQLGQLGRPVAEPTEVPGMEGKSVVRVVAGAWHSGALTEGGELWTWGDNRAGKLGHGGVGGDPTRPPGLVSTGDGAPLVSAALGDHHSLAVDEAGGLWAWGENKEGQLGIGTELQQIAKEHRENYDLVSALSAHGHSLPDGHLGAGQRGTAQRVGNPLVPPNLLADLLAASAPTASPATPSPTPPPPAATEPTGPGLEAEDVAEAAASRYFSVARTRGGRLWTFGAGFNNELAQDGLTWVTTATEVVGPPASLLEEGGGCARVAAGGTFCAALTRAGGCVVWGKVGAAHRAPSNPAFPEWGPSSAPATIVGEVGLGPGGAQGEGPRMVDVGGARLVAVAAGRAHAVLTDGARVWVIGGPEAPPSAPLEVFRMGSSGAGVAQVAAGFNSSAFITTDGHLFQWGGGLHPHAVEEGRGLLECTPQLVASMRGQKVRGVALGAKHTIVLASEC